VRADQRVGRDRHRPSTRGPALDAAAERQAAGQGIG
jgi:hypothetical protein